MEADPDDYDGLVGDVLVHVRRDDGITIKETRVQRMELVAALRGASGRMSGVRSPSA